MNFHEFIGALVDRRASHPDDIRPGQVLRILLHSSGMAPSASVSQVDARIASLIAGAVRHYLPDTDDPTADLRARAEAAHGAAVAQGAPSAPGIEEPEHGGTQLLLSLLDDIDDS